MSFYGVRFKTAKQIVCLFIIPTFNIVVEKILSYFFNWIYDHILIADLNFQKLVGSIFLESG